MTAAVTRPATARSPQLSADALAVMERFPPRPVPESWPETSADRFAVARRLLAPPFVLGDASARHWRKLGVLKLLDWLELQPGETWQQRWDSAGVGAVRPGDWRDRVLADLDDAGRLSPLDARVHSRLGAGMIQMIAGDVIRPGLPWLLTTLAPARLADEMGRVRDPAGMAALAALRESCTTGRRTFDLALERVAAIMAAKGGTVAAITPGDCVELLGCCQSVLTAGPQTNPFSPFFYQLLSAAGIFPPGAPPTVRMLSARFAGQMTIEQMIDRYDLACRPVRDLFVDYLRERQPGIDYSSLVGLSITLAKRFWKDLEDHHPGISSLHLPPDVAAAWKQRIQTRTVRTSGGGQQKVARQSVGDALMSVRGFYLDLAQWALDDPARWGRWAVPCPIRSGDIHAEWDEFLGHFKHRKLALGDCGRAYSTPCIHEHSCIRCPLLRIDPTQRHRLEEIRDNLISRIAEAEREGWAGEAEGLKVSLSAATSKLAQADLTQARRAEHVHLGIPAYRDIATTLEGPRGRR